jgi:hypothetical protein
MQQVGRVGVPLSFQSRAGGWIGAACRLTLRPSPAAALHAPTLPHRCTASLLSVTAWPART